MSDDSPMRTTLDIADDVLSAAKELAQLRGMTAGQVLSELARKGLETPDPETVIRNGVPLLPRRPGAPKMTLERVNELLDEL